MVVMLPPVMHVEPPHKVDLDKEVIGKDRGYVKISTVRQKTEED